MVRVVRLSKAPVREFPPEVTALFPFATTSVVLCMLHLCMRIVECMFEPIRVQIITIGGSVLVESVNQYFRNKGIHYQITWEAKTDPEKPDAVAAGDDKNNYKPVSLQGTCARKLLDNHDGVLDLLFKWATQ
jgi:hypothetical protein